MLARGELQTIGATTLDEYRKHLEKDAALERRFQPIQVAEPSVAHTIEILKGLRDRYEAHHRVSITDAALVAAASLADRYISDRFLPDKAIDLIDEAGSRMRIRRMTAPPDLREFDERIAGVRREKESAIDAQDFEKAASLRDKEKKLLGEKAQREKEWKAGDMDVVAEVDDEQIAEVLATWTGIPVFKLTEEETARLLRMEDELHKRVIGQEQAIKAVSQAIRRTRAGLKDPKRPGGSFIFAGPSGVGKTELSKTLAEFLFGDEDALIQLDMSEFIEKHTVSRLVGSPPGYVGYEEGGQLTEKVRRKPFSVVLFDEVEKAHPDVFNTLLQILEDGRLTDAQGRIVDFKNTVIIMTTNLGTRDISKGVSLGFAGGERQRERLRADEDQGQRRAQAALPARVPQPDRRHHRLPPADRGRDRRDRRPDARPGSTASCRTRTWASSSPRAPRRCWPRRATTRCSAPGRCAAPSSARSRTRCRRRSCSASWPPARSWWSTPRARASEPQFTFRGEPKPSPVPDTPPVADVAGGRRRRGVSRTTREGAGPDRGSRRLSARGGSARGVGVGRGGRAAGGSRCRWVGSAVSGSARRARGRVADRRPPGRVRLRDCSGSWAGWRLLSRSRVCGVRLTKLPHACVAIEQDGAVLVVDPGGFSDPADALRGADAVLVTHEHPDHLDVEAVHGGGGVRAAVFAHPEVRRKLTGVAEHAAWQPGDAVEVGRVPGVRVFGGRHAYIHEDVPDLPNNAYLIDERVYYAGDSFSLPGVPGGRGAGADRRAVAEDR